MSVTVTAALRDMQEAQELKEKWNEKVSLKGLDQFRAMYKTWLKSGVDPRFIKAMEYRSYCMAIRELRAHGYYKRANEITEFKHKVYGSF